MNRRRGLALLELLLYSALWTVLAFATLRAVADARMLRANARDRSALALIAQGEIERMRADAAPPAGGERTDPAWPSGTRAVTRVEPSGEGAVAVVVTVSRESLEGKPVVTLASILPGSVLP